MTFKFTPKLNNYLQDLQRQEQRILRSEKEGYVSLPKKDFKELIDAQAQMAIMLENLIVQLEKVAEDLGITLEIQ